VGQKRNIYLCGDNFFDYPKVRFKAKKVETTDLDGQGNHMAQKVV
jgi:hypothetical protein